MDFWSHLFDAAGFVPRKDCGLWTPGMIFLHNISDFLIWISYLAIPIVLVTFAYRRRHELPFNYLFLLFGLFIVACGTTHLMDIIMFYHPVYRIAGLVKLVTAAASVATVIALIPVIPVALAMRTPDELLKEINQREKAEEDLRVARDELEERVQERTAELAAAITQMQLAVHDAERANNAKDEFLSRMSHELRTPLNAILGFAQILRMHKLNPDQYEGLDQIVGAGKHLLSLVNEVLDITNIESGRHALSPESVPVAQAIQETLDITRPLAEPQGIQLSMSLAPGENRAVIADRQRLKQVLLNLVSNAIKYNRPHGDVVISCELGMGKAAAESSEDTATSTVATPGEYLRISVRDTGPGLTEEDMGKLFVPFERLKAASSTIEGTGIGLALSRNLVEAMGGHMHVESTVGQGSIFWFELPLAQSDAAVLPISEPLPIPQPAPLGVDGKHTILYVEDNASNLLLMQVLFKELDVQLITAIEGNAGLELARQHYPQLILLDLHLPNLSGYDILRRLKQDPATSGIPVVMVSADATPDQIERLRHAGAAEYLTKPLDVDAMLALVRKMLPQQNGVHANN